MKKNIVLLGIGHTNAHIIHQWERHAIEDCTLTCISKFPTATYSGMLPGTLGMQFSDDEMRIDLDSLCKRAGAKLILAETSGLDLQTGTLHFADHDSISFDALSIGVGSMPAGWETHAGAASLVPIKPMQTFLERLEQRMETVRDDSGRPLKVAIVGGGVASVEIALCLLQRCEKRNLSCEFSIEIFTSSDTVAEGMKPRSVRKIERILLSRSIHMTPGYRVTQVGDDFIETEDGSRYETDVVIWATGAAAPSVLGKLNLQTDDRGFIATSKTLQSLTDPRVFAVGDSGTVMDSPSPKAGVYAVRQCPILWHNLRSFLSDGSMETFEPQSDFLKLLNTGDGKALLQYGPFSIHARWCWHLKTWIDKRFISEFQVATIPSGKLPMKRMLPTAIFSLSIALAFLVSAQEAVIQVDASETGVTETTSKVPDGINDNFKNPELDVDEWIDRFEVESREVYPPGKLGDVVRLGELLIEETNEHPLTKPFVGNSLKCTSCHLNAGRHEKAGSFIGVAAAYPAFSPREQRVITLEDRILNCFIRSQNGTRPANGSEVPVAIATYITWLSQDTLLKMNPTNPLGPNHMTMLDNPPAEPSIERGKSLYQDRCSSCHADDGIGTDDGPPVWGSMSFNDGAGLADVPKMASWLKVAMPLDDADLSDQEAFDVAVYVNSNARPKFEAIPAQRNPAK